MTIVMLMAVMRYFCFDLPGNVALKTRKQKKQFIPNHRLPTFLGTFLNPLDDSEGSSMFFVPFYSECGCNEYVLLIRYPFFRLSEAGRTGGGVDRAPYFDG